MSVSLFDVQEAALPVRDDLKPALLAEVLRRSESEPVLVFVRTKNRADRLAQWLKDQGFQADRVHGNRSPAQRVRALGEFRSGGLKALIVTDLGGKVDELPSLGALVHFDVPGAEDYLSRLELTYGGDPGPAAYTLVGDLEIRELRGVERVLGRALPPRSLEDFDYDVIEVDELFEPVGPPVAVVAAAATRAQGHAQGQGHSQGQIQGKNKRRKGRRRGGAAVGGGHERSGGHHGGHGNYGSNGNPGSNGYGSNGNSNGGGPSPERIERLIAAAAEKSGARGRRPGEGPGTTHVPAAFRNVGKMVP